MPKTVADYDDAVRRIAEADVPDDATTEEEVRRALRDADAPQVTGEVADGIADSILTEDRVIEAIEASGELPGEDEIDAIVNVSDDYGMDDRVESVEAGVRDRVATREDVTRSINERREQKGSRPTFREDVEAAVDSVAERKQIVGEGPAEITQERSRELGAPSEQEFDRARTRTIAQGEQVSPSEIGVSDRKTPVSVVTNDSGEAVGVVGGSNAEDRRGVAEHVGANRVFDSINDLENSFGLDQSPGRATLTIDGEAVGEVDVE